MTLIRGVGTISYIIWSDSEKVEAFSRSAEGKWNVYLEACIERWRSGVRRNAVEGMVSNGAIVGGRSIVVLIDEAEFRPTEFDARSVAFLARSTKFVRRLGVELLPRETVSAPSARKLVNL